MIGFGIEVRGLKKVQKKVDKLEDFLTGGLARVFRKVPFVLERETKLTTTGGRPLNVQTGRLRSSWIVGGQENVITQKSGRKEWSLSFGSNVVYAAIHEYGGLAGRGLTVQIPARRYVTKARNAAEPKVEKLFQDAVQKIVRGR